MFFRSQKIFFILFLCEWRLEMCGSCCDTVWLPKTESPLTRYLRLHLHLPPPTCSLLVSICLFSLISYAFPPTCLSLTSHALRNTFFFARRSAWSATRWSRRCVIRPLPVVRRQKSEKAARCASLSVACSDSPVIGGERRVGWREGEAEEEMAEEGVSHAS